MTTAIDPKRIASSVCDDLVRDVVTRHGRSFIVTTYRYPDGDTLNIYLERRDGQNWLSDGGATLFKAATDGMKITEARQRVIDVICREYGIEQVDSTFSRKVDLRRVSDSFLPLCEAITRISTLRYELLHRPRSDLRELIDSLLEDRVAPIRRWDTHWTDPSIDHKAAFPVDYRFNGKLPPRHLFRVSSPYKAALVAAVGGFLESHGAAVPTMCVIDPEVGLGDQHLYRVQMVATEICFGVDADRIVKFVLAR